MSDVTGLDWFCGEMIRPLPLLVALLFVCLYVLCIPCSYGEIQNISSVVEGGGVPINVLYLFIFFTECRASLSSRGGPYQYF